jgi:hypothetical protein
MADVNREMQDMYRAVWGKEPLPGTDYSAWRRLSGTQEGVCCGCGQKRLLEWEHGDCYRDEWCKFRQHYDSNYACIVCADCIKDKAV